MYEVARYWKQNMREIEYFPIVEYYIIFYSTSNNYKFVFHVLGYNFMVFLVHKVKDEVTQNVRRSVGAP